MQEKKVRIAKWDNLKFFLILCVVLGHFLARYDDNQSVKSLIFFLYTFHMPAFIFLSGLFSKRTVNEKRYDKIFSFLIMYIVTKYALFFIRALYSKDYTFSYFEMNDVSWYAFAVFVFYLLTIFFRQFSAKYMLIFSVALACVSGYAEDIGTYLSLARIISYYPFFLLGYYLDVNDVLKICQKKITKVFSVIWILAVAAVSYLKINDIYWYLKILKGKTPYSSLGQYESWGALLRLGWYAAAVLLIFALIAITPSVHCIFTKWGGRTLQVYVLHYIPMLAFFSLFHWNKAVEAAWPEHYLILIILIAVLTTCVLSIKPISIVMNAIIYPKKRKE